MAESRHRIRLTRLFPKLPGFDLARVDLDAEARRWADGRRISSGNPLLDPDTCQAFVEECHRRYATNGSYGGWMEDRRALWRGSYLDADGRYAHLGVDVNVPGNTAVALPRPGRILRIDDDFPEPHGWGGRVIVRPEGLNAVAIFAHISVDSGLRTGDGLPAGTIIGCVGLPPRNGGWFPHLHVQLVALPWYEELLKDDLRDLDGYGNPEDISLLAERFPNPLPFMADG